MRKFGCGAFLVWLLAFGICACGGSAESSDSAVFYEDVSDINEAAGRAWDQGQFKESLKQYAEAMKANPVDMDSRIGMVRCQIALGNYDLAGTNLEAALKVDPRNEEIYDLYVELSEKADRLSYARTAVNQARIYGVQSFLDRVPSSPELELGEGEYDSRIELGISAQEGAQIYVTEKKNQGQRTNYLYAAPVSITRGTTELEVYCVKDGIPSESVKARYICEYAPVEVVFEDPVLEKMVRASLNRLEGPVTDADCEGVTRLSHYDIRAAFGMDYEEYEQAKVSTLNDLYWLPGLLELYLNGQSVITDFSPMTQCRKLRTVDVADCGVSDISFVESMANLDYFRAGGNEIADVTPLSGCKSLDSLYIDNNPVADLSPLSGIDLRYLSVSASQIADSSVLKSLPELRYLSLYGCGGFDFSVLADMPELKELFAYAGDNRSDGETPIGDLSFVERLTGLERLSLSGITDYSQIGLAGNLPNLNYLYFSTLKYSEPPQELVDELRQKLPGCEIRY